MIGDQTRTDGKPKLSVINDTEPEPDEFADFYDAPTAENDVSQKVVTSIDVRGPKKEEYFRTHAGKDFEINTDFRVIGYRPPDELRTVDFLLAKPLWGRAPQFEKTVRLFACVNQNNTPFTVACTLPKSGFSHNRWYSSLLENLEHGKTEWVKSIANQAEGKYDLWVPKIGMKEPVWPSNVDWPKWLKLSFPPDRWVITAEHPVWKAIFGE